MRKPTATVSKADSSVDGEPEGSLFAGLNSQLSAHMQAPPGAPYETSVLVLSNLRLTLLPLLCRILEVRKGKF